MRTASVRMPIDPVRSCIITGAGGYVGGALARRLAALNFNVIPLSRSNGFQLGDASVALPDRPADALVHCAYDFGLTDWSDIERVNVQGSLRLFEAAQRRGIRNLIFVSSLAAYDGSVSMYGRGKQTVERAILSAGGQVIRRGTVFGPAPRGLMGALTASVRGRSVIPVPGGVGRLSLVHEDDLAELVAALASEKLGRSATPWLAAGARTWSVPEIVSEIGRRENRRVRVLEIPWRLVWSGLRTLETFGIRGSFRSDSLLSLARPIPAAQLAALQRPPNIRFREF